MSFFNRLYPGVKFSLFALSWTFYIFFVWSSTTKQILVTGSHLSIVRTRIFTWCKRLPPQSENNEIRFGCFQIKSIESYRPEYEKTYMYSLYVIHGKCSSTFRQMFNFGKGPIKVWLGIKSNT